MTLVGFLRDDRLNVYAHPERVLVGAPACERLHTRGRTRRSISG